MTGVVVFNRAAFVVKFPAFAAYNTANPTGLQMFFDSTALLLNNTTTSRVHDLTKRALLLDLLTAHLAQLGGVLNAAGAAQNPVGRVSSASEGSVSASFDAGPVTNSQAWYLQTQYGALYWQATALFRAFRYSPNNRRC